MARHTKVTVPQSEAQSERRSKEGLREIFGGVNENLLHARRCVRAERLGTEVVDLRQRCRLLGRGAQRLVLHEGMVERERRVRVIARVALHLCDVKVRGQGAVGEEESEGHAVSPNEREAHAKRAQLYHIMHECLRANGASPRLRTVAVEVTD